MKLNMFSKSVVFLNLAFASIFMSAKEIKYKVSDIPIELTKNAKAVIRNSEIKFLVKDINSAQMDVNYAITVLNENGIENSRLMEFCIILPGFCIMITMLQLKKQSFR